MRCISPIFIRNKKYVGNVPCGKCNFCLEARRNDWSFRLAQELKHSFSSFFLTLTYEETVIPINQESGLSEVCKRDLQLFVKRLRKENAKLCAWPIRYYNVGEYGSETHRPHYHSVMFNLALDVAERLDQVWHLGHCYVGSVTPASIHYVTKYHVNPVGEELGRAPPFAFMSKRPGIGAKYVDTHCKWHRDDQRNFTKVNGFTGRLPRYYKEKIFSDLERRLLAQASVIEADLSYSETVVSLARFHSDPYAYFDERVSAHHESIISKSKFVNPRRV